MGHVACMQTSPLPKKSYGENTNGGNLNSYAMLQGKGLF